MNAAVPIRSSTLLLAILVAAGRLPAQTAAGGKPLDVTPFIEMAELHPSPVKPQKDEKTGFVVGGRNATDLILTVTEFNGRTIAELEKDMRPKAASNAGFLGPNEKLLEILAADNRYVVDELGLKHQELARHLHAMGTIGNWQERHEQEGAEFVYQGKRFKVQVEHTRGIQPSPFRDGTASGSNATVTNLDNGKKVRYGLLVPYMIERYGFYEGKGTPYRLEPRLVLEVFDFLMAKKK
jgi:hypothetical protein